MNSRLLGQSDKYGNDLFLQIFSDDNGVDVGCTVYLKLKSENKHRNLGNIYYKDRSFHVTRDSSKHFHYISKSYGFNWTILGDAELNIKTIHLIVSAKVEVLNDKNDGIKEFVITRDKYIIPISVFKTYGKFLSFMQQGFELQKFLPLDIIVNFKDDSYIPEKSIEVE
jgi:hypothetical protein